MTSGASLPARAAGLPRAATRHHGGATGAGSTATALELQWQYLEWARAYAESAQPTGVFTEVLAAWEEVLEDLAGVSQGAIGEVVHGMLDSHALCLTLLGPVKEKELPWKTLDL